MGSRQSRNPRAPERIPDARVPGDTCSSCCSLRGPRRSANKHPQQDQAAHNEHTRRHAQTL
eukprot:2753320-Alexandrium_andersonii.AAC.1